MTYQYNDAYFMGDIIQIANEYGLKSRSRITEVMRGKDTSGYSLIPTLSKI